MTSTAHLDQAIREHLEQEQRDADLPTEGRPVIAWALVAATLGDDPEEPDVWLIGPNGAPGFMATGLLHEALATRDPTTED